MMKKDRPRRRLHSGLLIRLFFAVPLLTGIFLFLWFAQKNAQLEAAWTESLG